MSNNAFVLGDEGLTPAAYRPLEHAASLKGLLQPFKGKGDLEVCAHMAQLIAQQLTGLMAALAQQTEAMPFTLLGIRLALQSSASGSVFLRWRTRDYLRMGVEVWDQQMRDPALPDALRQRLRVMERDRITLNMQMSVVQSLRRQAIACADKMQHVEQMQPPLTPSRPLP